MRHRVIGPNDLSTTNTPTGRGVENETKHPTVTYQFRIEFICPNDCHAIRMFHAMHSTIILNKYEFYANRKLLRLHLYMNAND